MAEWVKVDIAWGSSLQLNKKIDIVPVFHGLGYKLTILAWITDEGFVKLLRYFTFALLHSDCESNT